MNKKITTELAIGIILIIAVIISGLIWFGSKQQLQIPTQQIVPEQPKKSVIPIQPTVQPTQQDTQTQQSLINWGMIQFDSCGNKNKYEKLPWWDKFVAQIEKYNYYSDDFIGFSLNGASENEYLNPEKTKYTYETFCNSRIGNNTSICVNKGRKLSINDLGDYGEGCLAKDGTAFIVAFPGEYGGGGNYIFRYDVNDNILEKANILNENKYSWGAPPSSFGKRVGDTIKMSGSIGDAGCGTNTEFDYNFIENQVKMTKRCTQCQDEKPKCELFRVI